MHDAPAAIRTRLVTLVLVSVLPGALLVSALLVSEYAQERRRVEESTVSTARALATALDQRIAAAQAALAVLATSRLIWHENLDAFHEQATEVKRLQGFSVIGLIDPQLQPLMNTLQPLGSPLAKPGSAERVQEVFITGRPVVTGLFQGSVNRNHAVAVAAPVLHGGGVPYAVIGGIDPAALSRVLHDQNLPRTWVVTLVDKQGQVVARSSEHERFVGTRLPEAYLARLRQAPEGTDNGPSLTGEPVLTAYSQTPLSGWTVGISIPRAELTGPLQRGLAWLGAGTAAVLLAGGIAAWRLRRSITWTIARLKAQAADLGRGGPAHPFPAAFAEGNDLSTALHSAALERQTARAELEHFSNRLAGVVESAMDAIVSTNQNHEIVLFNRAAETIFGWDRAQVMGRPLDVLLPQRLQGRHRDHMGTFAASGTTTRRMGALPIVSGLRADGTEFPIEATISQVDTPDGKLYTAVVRDVSEKVRAAQEVTALRTEASAVRERDKKKIARELHDDVVQTLAAVKLDGNWLLARELDDEPARRVRRMIALADSAIIALRRIAADLRPAALDELGFVAALEDLTDTLTERFGVACSLHVDRRLDLHEPHATEVFRIVQEALSNVAKHAQATRVEVHLECRDDDLVVRVRDNGVGFAMDTPRSRHSLGLVGLRERVELLRGSLSIDSRPGAGTTVEVLAPAAVGAVGDSQS
jgi:PAS domain S-box-containing protein